MYKFFNYYNSLCVGANSPTVFSFDPYLSAIKEMLVSELREIVFYVEKLRDLNEDMSEYRDKVIEFISVLVVNLDFRRESLFVIVEDLYKNKTNLQNLYKSICEQKNIKPEIINENAIALSDKESIIKALNEHEKNISDNSGKLSVNKKNLYEIMVHLVLNACNCLIELKNYGYDYVVAKEQVLKLFNASNLPSSDEEIWIDKIKDFSKCNYLIMKKLYEVIVEKYGPVEKSHVQFQIKKCKAILVSDSNFSDLKAILDATLPYNINVYTHHEMISAFQYKQLKKYKNLVGHYQRSSNNFPLDFSSFPGPIYISKNSIPKIDVIRGQIYTSAKYPAFGFAKVENNDYSEMIDYAISSVGFEEDSVINSLEIGYDDDKVNDKLDDIVAKFINKEIEHIAIIGLVDKFAFSNDYIKIFFDKAPHNCYIISFAQNSTRKNFWNVSSYYDFSLVYKVLEKLTKSINNPSQNISFFLPDCSINTISYIFNLMYLGISKIFLGPCCPNVMNPILVDGLESIFNIKELTNPKDDLLSAMKK